MSNFWYNPINIIIIIICIILFNNIAESSVTYRWTPSSCSILCDDLRYNVHIKIDNEPFKVTYPLHPGNTITFQPDLGSVVTVAVQGQRAEDEALSLMSDPSIPYLYRGEDTDRDGVFDYLDNCTLVTNPTQIDSDNDGFGNICDADFDNNGIVGISDMGTVLRCMAMPGVLCDQTDLNGDGTTSMDDITLFRNYFGKPPGPNGSLP